MYIFCNFYLSSSSSSSSFSSSSSSSSSSSLYILTSSSSSSVYILPPSSSSSSSFSIYILTSAADPDCHRHICSSSSILQQKQRLITYLLPLQQPHARSTGEPRVSVPGIRPSEEGEGPFQPSRGVFVTDVQCISKYISSAFSLPLQHRYVLRLRYKVRWPLMSLSSSLL